jgi:leucyl-tRNA synthetase
MVLNHIYSRKGAKGGVEYFWPADVDDVHDEHGKVIGARLKSDGSMVNYEGVGTMSKSKNNGVDPQDLIEKYGADTARLYTMFTAPPEATLEWNDAAVEGSYRFLRRVWNFLAEHRSREDDTFSEFSFNMAKKAKFEGAGKDVAQLRRDIHTTLRQITFDYERIQYNTVVSGCMKLFNSLASYEPSILVEVGTQNENDLSVSLAAFHEASSILIRVLYPVAPHLAHALWTDLGFTQEHGDLLDAPWPEVDASALQQDEIELVLQVNGKLRGSVTVPAGAGRAAIEAAALASEAFIKQAAGAPAKKVIVVPGRLVNIVV